MLDSGEVRNAGLDFMITLADTFRELKSDLLRMNVEFVFMPPDQEVSRTVQIVELAFLDGLNSNEMLNLVTLVKNAAYLVLTRIYG